MKRYEITYTENGEFEILNIYGFENFVTFMEENGRYIDLICIDEYDVYTNIGGVVRWRGNL